MRHLAFPSVLSVTLLACMETAGPSELTTARFQVVTSSLGYTAIDLGNLGGNFSFATAINDAGQVVGSSFTPSGTLFHAFLWDGTMHDLGTLTGDFSGATGISAAGHVVGNWGTGGSVATNRVFLWDGTMHDLGRFGGTFISATGINDSGHVVGFITTPTPEQLAFLWDGTTTHTLGTLPGKTYSRAFAINDAGLVVGESGVALSDAHAFLWDGTMHDLGTLGGARSSARAVNSAGLVVGESQTASGERHAFLWDGTMMHDLGTLGGTTSGATGINDFGVVVGFSTTASGGFVHAFVWDGAMHDLGTLGGATSGASAINNAGQVVGFSQTAAGENRATLWQQLTPVGQLQTCSTLASSLETNGALTTGQARSLLNKINLATALLNQGKTIPALNVLEALLNEVNALAQGGVLTPGSASQLTACVQPVVDAVSN